MGKKIGAEVARCPWPKQDDYIAYHDEEWGVPVHDDRRLFESLVLGGAQAGLSWYTVLRKRDNYRAAFHDFDVQAVARMNARQIEPLMLDAGLIRNRMKLESVPVNAKAVLKVQEEFGSLDAYLWQFVEGRPIQNARQSMAEVPAVTAESDAMSKDLKKRGFKFVGSTICYAVMQGVGMVNDHLTSCFRHQELRRKPKK